jgi:AcrR family transcriptional regulator
MIKKNALLDAAFDLFAKAGVHGATIDQIVEKAGVAKGTFYLYFKNKYDILDMIVIRKTSALLRDAIMASKTRSFTDRIDEVLCVADYLIDHLTQDKLMMRIIHKNLSFSLYQKVLNDPARGAELKKIVEEFKKNVICDGYSEQEIDHLPFILLEMIGSVCYSSIINNEPAPLGVVKPILLKTIRKILA